MNRIIKKLKNIIRVFLTVLLGNNFEKLEKKNLDNISIASFDVFDTLIIRTGIKRPTDVFDLVDSEDIDFKTKRIMAEAKARSKSNLEDIKLTDIYLNLFSEDINKVREYEQKEINAELSVCKANPKAYTFYNKIKNSGKRIIIVSDMYLKKETIEKLLINCHYDINDVPIYVSSEYGKTKRSGSLFKEVLKNEKVDASKVIHIGDNLMSDYFNSKKCGIVGYLYNGK
ncbi:MAG: HAD-IA family hydrolase [Clostridia bacterium]|nr:HAD-IA family hydrolase [Clostridia bacterium]